MPGLDDFYNNTQLADSSIVKACATHMDNAVMALGAWLDGLTERVKECGKTEGISFKGESFSMSRLADAGRTPPVQGAPPDEPAQGKGLAIEKNLDVVAQVGGLKLPPNIPAPVHYETAQLTGQHDMGTVCTSALSTGGPSVQTNSLQCAL
jgi:hypothetical protein